MPYKILEHPADEKFRAEGETVEEAFSEAVKAFSEIVGGDEGMYHHKVSVESKGYEALLFDFLDELIFLQDTEGVVVSHAEDLEIEDTGKGHRLTAKILVDDISDKMALLDIKAPTYSEMKVDHEDGKWILEAVLDI
ncbi:MAG: archease [Candidatus Nanohalobium sp.]